MEILLIPFIYISIVGVIYGLYKWISILDEKPTGESGRKGGREMKAKELMVGDWVNQKYGGKPSQIETILYGGVGLKEEDGYRLNAGEELIEPIPLTKEILEENDFVYNENYHCYVLYRDCAVSIKVGVFTEGDFRFNIFSYLKEIKYVHELQHALRLCGLNELADNFKIE